MSAVRRRALAERAATALAGAFLAGTWEPRSMARRGQRSLGDRRSWILQVARVAHAAHHEPPIDRPGELAALIGACDSAQAALHDPMRPPRVRVWIAAPTTMVRRPWPVPVLDDVAALAAWLDLDLDLLAWYADRRGYERTARDKRLVHHRRTWVPKRDGSVRLLEAPKDALRTLQRRVLHEIVDLVPAHDAAHGFRRGRSARTGATHHRGRAVVIGLDLESFFTSVTRARVDGIFRTAGYPEPVAHALAALCTTVTPTRVLRDAPPIADARRDAHRRLVQRLREPHLAQGAPTSPALANLAAFTLDERITGLARRFDATYTRYADDLALSGGPALRRAAPTVIASIRRIALDEGFTLNDTKTRVRTAAARQEVTGLVVNRGVNVPRDEFDRLKAILHDAARHGPAHANRERHPAFRDHLLGRIGWVGGGNATRAAKLHEAFDAIAWDA